MVMYSHSRLSCFEQCPLKFYYTYIDKPDLEEVLGESIATFLGSRAHETLHKLYEDVVMMEKATLEGVVEYYQDQWEREWTDDIIVPKYDVGNYRQLGVKYLTDYYNTYKPFDQEKTIAMERRVEVKIGKYKLQGSVDRITETKPGNYQIRDYKTNKYLSGQKYFDDDRQLALYQIGLEAMFDDVEDVELVWHMLHFNKEVRSKRTPEQLEKLKADTEALIDSIEMATEFEPAEGPLCEWCVYQMHCPRKSHGYLTEKMTVREFRKDEGVKLANQYYHTYRKMKEWEDRTDMAKGEVLAYSQQHNQTKLIGSNAALGVYPHKTPSFDPKAEDILKKRGVWEEFSKLDSWALSKAIDKAGFHLRGELEPLREMKESQYVRILKKPEE
jgi:putative RecB family exonuclease